MKKYNAMIGASVLFYGLLALLLGVLLLHRQREQGQFYKVEINRILAEIESPEDIETIDLALYGNVRAVSYLSAAEQERGGKMWRAGCGLTMRKIPLFPGHFFWRRERCFWQGCSCLRFYFI